MRLRTLVALCLLMSGCAKPKPSSSTLPSPPAVRIERKTYLPQPVHPGDMPISGCTVTAESGNRADCICRRAVTKIDVHESGKPSLICK
jgi:hypothetical protein